MKALKIFYTLPYYIPETEKDGYSLYLDYNQVSKDKNLPFEMISFQDSPGRFLTEKAVFNEMSGSDDSIFPITVLDGEIVKTASLPTGDEFSSWFEQLGSISYEKLKEYAKDVEHYHFPISDEFTASCCASGCATCEIGNCGMFNFSLNELNDFDD